MSGKLAPARGCICIAVFIVSFCFWLLVFTVASWWPW